MLSSGDTRKQDKWAPVLMAVTFWREEIYNKKTKNRQEDDGNRYKESKTGQFNRALLCCYLNDKKPTLLLLVNSFFPPSKSSFRF